MPRVKKVVNEEVDGQGRNEEVGLEAETPTPVPTPTSPMSYEEKKARTKAILDAEPKISYMIPLGDREKEGASEVMVVNGYSYIIKKGERVMIPQTIADLLDARFTSLAQLGKTAGVEGQDVRIEAAEARLNSAQ